MQLWLLLLLATMRAQTTPQPALKAWTAPSQFQLPEPAKPGADRDAIPSTPLNLIAIQPCRLLDTRGTAPASQRLLSGPIAANTPTTVPIPSGPCAVPSTALAYSLNITVDNTGTGPVAFLSAWPTGSPPALMISVLNATQIGYEANAAVIAAGTNGAIDLFASNPTHVIIDINGYYTVAPGQGPVASYHAPPIPLGIACIALIRDIYIDFSIKEIDTANAVTTGSNWTFTAPLAGHYFLTSTLDQPLDVLTFSLEIHPSAQSLLPAFQTLRTVNKGANFTISTALYLREGERIRMKANTGGCGGAGWISIHYVRP